MAFLHKTDPVAISANPATITSSASIPAGSLIILDLTEYYGGSAPQAVASVVDDVNTGAYSIAISEGASGLVVSAIFYKIADATGTPTVTVTFSGAGTPPGTLSLRVFDGEHTVLGPTSSGYSASTTTPAPGAVNPSGSALYLALYCPHFVYVTLTNTAGWTQRAVRTAIDGSGPIEHYSIDTVTTGSQNPVVTLGAASEVSCVVATFELTTEPPQKARPNADVSAGAWVPSTGSDNYAVIDETPASDADYTSTPNNSTLRVGLAPLSTPGAGTQTFRFRAAGSPAKQLIVSLLEAAGTLRGTLTVDPLPAAFTDYSFAPSGVADYADLDASFEVQDASSPPEPTVAFGAIGTTGSTTATTSVTAAYPTGITTESALYLVVTGRSNTAGTEFAVTGGGWTIVGTFEGGTGTWGVDAGTRRVTVFRKDSVSGSESGNVTVTLAGTTANTLYARIVRVQPPTGYTISEAFASGADTSAGTSFSATASSSLSWQAGDLLLIAVASSTDTATQSAQSITASGVTFGTRTNRASIAVTGGNDHRHIVDTVPVTAGSGSSAPTYSYTASASTSGPVGFLRLRAVPPATAGMVSFSELEVPAAAGGGPTIISVDGVAAGSAQAAAAAGAEASAAGVSQAVAQAAGALSAVASVSAEAGAPGQAQGGALALAARDASAGSAGQAAAPALAAVGASGASDAASQAAGAPVALALADGAADAPEQAAAAHVALALAQAAAQASEPAAAPASATAAAAGAADAPEQAGAGAAAVTARSAESAASEQAAAAALALAARDATAEAPVQAAATQSAIAAAAGAADAPEPAAGAAAATAAAQGVSAVPQQADGNTGATLFVGVDALSYAGGPASAPVAAQVAVAAAADAASQAAGAPGAVHSVTAVSQAGEQAAVDTGARTVLAVDGSAGAAGQAAGAAAAVASVAAAADAPEQAAGAALALHAADAVAQAPQQASAEPISGSIVAVDGIAGSSAPAAAPVLAIAAASAQVSTPAQAAAAASATAAVSAESQAAGQASADAAGRATVAVDAIASAPQQAAAPQGEEAEPPTVPQPGGGGRLVTPSFKLQKRTKRRVVAVDGVSSATAQAAASVQALIAVAAAAASAAQHGTAALPLGSMVADKWLAARMEELEFERNVLANL